MQNLDTLLLKKLDEREQLSQIRGRLLLESQQASSIVVGGKAYVNFSSNDYLGLANHPDTLHAVNQQLAVSGFGSGASHLITGHHQIHEKLESTLANFLKRDAAITFSTGYMANLSILQSLAAKGDLLIADKLNHASLIDGIKLSAANSARYPHCDLNIARAKAKKMAANKWVVTDGVFSMDGDIAPLDKIAGLCKKYHAHLIVDDAHGFGVLGENGRGCVEHFGLSQTDLPILMGTFGKALGGFGAFVSGSQPLIDYLMQFARPYVYTTALPPSVAAANYCNLNLLMSHPELRCKLKRNIRHFRTKCMQENIKLQLSETAIQPIMIGDTQKLLQVDNELKKRGILVGAIRPPTVATNTDRLRLTLTASHSFEQIDFLIKQLADRDKI